MIEIAILIPLSIYLIDQSNKSRSTNEEQNRSIDKLILKVESLHTAIETETETNSLKISHMADLIDNIWRNVET